MLLNTLSIITISALFQIAAAETITHAAGAEGTVMGPVQFLWPADRPWSADADNTAPCGSNFGVTNRTQFPLGECTSSIQNAKYAERKADIDVAIDNGAVSLSIATTAYQVAFRIAYNNSERPFLTCGHESLTFF
jgi:hypothetical protein